MKTKRNFYSAFLSEKMFFLFIVCLAPVFLNANNEKKIDSLLKFISLSKDDTLKANAYLNVGIEYENNDPHQSISYYNKYLEIAKKINYKKGIANAYYKISNTYRIINDFQKALDYALKAQSAYEELKDENGKAISNHLLGNVYNGQNQPELAKTYFLKAAEINIKLKNDSRLSANYNNLGLVHYHMKEYDMAIEYLTRSLELRKKIKDYGAMATSLSNLGVMCIELKQYEKGIKYQFEAMEICKKTKNTIVLLSCYENISDSYFRLGNMKEAIDYNKLALDLAKMIKLPEKTLAIYETSSNINEKIGNYKKALDFQRKYSVLKDSIFTSEFSKQINQMQAKYDSDQKEKKINLLQKDQQINNLAFINKEKELKHQKLINYLTIIGLCLILIFLFFIYRGYQNKKKANTLLTKQKIEIIQKNNALHQANEEINKKNNELEIQKNLLAQFNENLMDSIAYAKTIQDSILPSADVVKQVMPKSFVLYKPKDIVSGDFYWIYKESENDIMIAAADCTGHGVPGAFMSITGFNLLEQIVKEHHTSSPEDILKELNQMMSKILARKSKESFIIDGMDISLCKIRLKEKKIEFAGAHNPLYIVRGNDLIELKADKQSIGNKLSDMGNGFTKQEINLHDGDSIYLFSDGYADQMGGPRKKRLGFNAFKQLLISINNLSMDDQKLRLDEFFYEWKASKDQIDDILVMGIRA